MESLDDANQDRNHSTRCALQFRTLRDDKISFRFWPSKICRFFRPTCSFLGVLVLKRNIWTVKADTFPVTCKSIIYKLFYKENIDVMQAIYYIYDILEDFSLEYNEFKERRFQRYISGDPDIILFSDEEDMFLTPEERTEYRAKREKILQRMIPPPEILLQRRNEAARRQTTIKRKLTEKKRKHHVILESSSDSEDRNVNTKTVKFSKYKKQVNKKKRIRNILTLKSTTESEDDSINTSLTKFRKNRNQLKRNRKDVLLQSSTDSEDENFNLKKTKVTNCETRPIVATYSVDEGISKLIENKTQRKKNEETNKPEVSKKKTQQKIGDDVHEFTEKKNQRKRTKLSENKSQRKAIEKKHATISKFSTKKTQKQQKKTEIQHKQADYENETITKFAENKPIGNEDQIISKLSSLQPFTKLCDKILASQDNSHERTKISKQTLQLFSKLSDSKTKEKRYSRNKRIPLRKNVGASKLKEITTFKENKTQSKKKRASNFDPNKKIVLQTTIPEEVLIEPNKVQDKINVTRKKTNDENIFTDHFNPVKKSTKRVYYSGSSSSSLEDTCRTLVEIAMVHRTDYISE